MAEFTKEEKEILSNYFSSTTSDIFALINLPEVVKGSLFSRYSRTPKSIRRLFLDEFFYGETKELFKTAKKEKEGVDVTKAEEFYERILVGYGDDSVAELGGVHLAFENITNVAAKFIENSRIGISPLEKSSRYVFFDQKVRGKYQYLREKKIMASPFAKEYEETMDFLFETYSEVVRDIYEELIKTIEKPADVSEGVFKASCRGKACDVARYLLPMSTLTNVGVFANGRSLEYLLIKMGASELSEMQDLQKKITNEARKVIPAFIKRANNQRGEIYQNYLRQTNLLIERMASKVRTRTNGKFKAINEENTVELLEWEKNPEVRTLALLLYPHSNLSFEEVLDNVSDLPKEKVFKMLEASVKGRLNRHHKPMRGFEEIHYTFEIESDIGAFRDMQRHRVLTQEKQWYTTKLGYTIPQELKALPKLLIRYQEAMERADNLYRKLYKTMPYEAGYAVPFGYRIRYLLRMNLREAIHMTELRSISQGHPSYRKLAQQMAKLVTKVHPEISKYAFKFVDYKSYELERLEAFKKIEEKAKKLGKTAFI